MLQLLRPVIPNLSWLFLTFHLEYPSVLSIFLDKLSDIKLKNYNLSNAFLYFEALLSAQIGSTNELRPEASKIQ